MKYIFIITFTGVLMFGCSGKNPGTLGISNGKLTPCPSKPNCVSSQETDDKTHGIDPIRYHTPATAAYNKIKGIINAMDRTTIIEEKPDYLRVEFKSKIMGFVDDVEFYFPGNGQIEMRSASRIGYSDLGVNRKRLEHIRSLFNKK